MAVVYAGTRLSLEQREGGILALALDASGRDENLIDETFLVELEEACRQAANQTARLLVVYSRKPTGFCAGADLQMFENVQSPEEASDLSARGQRAFGALADLATPSLAVIHGECFDGGLELALACDYRVGVEAGALMSFRQLDVGLISCWGGTQSLPKLVGFARAIDMMLQRGHVDSKLALQLGLIDAVAAAEDGPMEHRLASLAQRFAGKRRIARQAGTWRQRFFDKTTIGRSIVLRGARHFIRRKVPDDMPAPQMAVDAVYVGLERGAGAGLAYEREAMGRLAGSEAGRILLGLALNVLRRMRSADGSPGVNKVGILGFDGPALSIAYKGLDVIVRVRSEEAKAKAQQTLDYFSRLAVQRDLRSLRDFEKVELTTCWNGFESADVILLCETEPAARDRALSELGNTLARRRAVADIGWPLWTKTIQRSGDQRGRFLGLHFADELRGRTWYESRTAWWIRDPAEVVQASETEEWALQAIVGLVRRLARVPLVMRDRPGLVVGRLCAMYLREAFFLAAQGVSVARIDQDIRRFGMSAGPFELLNEPWWREPAISLLGDSIRDFDAFLKPLALKRARKKGEKTGLFYAGAGFSKKPRRETARLLRELVRLPPIPGDPSLPVARSEVRERLVLITVNEAAKCLAEGVADDPQTIDLAAVLGMGWAAHRGGPLRYADSRGLGPVVMALEDLARTTGNRFAPCEDLRRRATTGESYYPRSSSSPAGP